MAERGRGRGGVAAGVGLLAALPLGWAAYSATGVDHAMPLPPAVDAERRTVRGARSGELSYYASERTHADGAGPADVPLLLLHSINAAGSAYEVRPLFERLRGRRRVYALDLPGFGYSERSDREYTPDLYATAVVEWLELVLPDEACDVLALSLTGEFAAMAAVRAPERVRSLALVSPTGFTLPAQRRGVQQRSATGGSERVLRVLTARPLAQPLYDALASRPSIKFFLKQSFEGPVDRGLAEYDYLTAHQPGARFAPLAFVSGRLFTPDVLERYYRRVAAPALVLHDDAPYGTFDALPGLERERPNWRGRYVGPTRGLPHFERPEATLEVLTGFWTSAGEGMTAPLTAA